MVLEVETGDGETGFAWILASKESVLTDLSLSFALQLDLLRVTSRVCDAVLLRSSGDTNGAKAEKLAATVENLSVALQDALGVLGKPHAVLARRSSLSTMPVPEHGADQPCNTPESSVAERPAQTPRSKSVVSNRTVDSRPPLLRLSGLECMWPIWRDPPSRSPSLRSEVRESPRRLAPSGTESLFNADSRKINDIGRSRFWTLLAPFVLFPMSPRRVCWDLLSVLVLVYELFTVPLSVFAYDELDAAARLRLVTMIFWTIDIPCSFLVGFDERGHTEVRPHKVAKHYLGSWFGLDILIVGTDWLMLSIGAPPGAASVGRIGKTFRLVRVLRLLRILRIGKLASISDKLGKSVQGTFVTVLNILQWMGCLLLICHCVACSWYWVGTISGSEDETWISDTEVLSSQPVRPVHLYAISLHWAFAQFAPSQSPYFPRTLGEQIFNILIIFFGLALFSSFIGSITTTITSFRATTRESSQQQNLFRHYAIQHDLSWELGRDITTYAKYHQRRKQRILERDVDFLKSLPESMRMELHCQVLGPSLAKHPFFDKLLVNYPLSLMFICHIAASEACYCRGDELFAYGATCSRMFVVVGGMLEYLEGFQGERVRRKKFRKDMWVAELSLWLDQKHGGRLTAPDDTYVAEVSSERFRQVFRKNPASLPLAQHYARLFANRISQEAEIDTWCDMESATEMAEEAFARTAESTAADASEEL